MNSLLNYYYTKKKLLLKSINRALGVTFYQMCTKNLPFKEINRDECKDEVINKPTPKLPDIYKDYQKLFEK